MRKLGEILNLQPERRRVLFFPFLKKFSQISGNIQNKFVTIFYSRSGQSQRRIVAQIQLNSVNDISFCAARKRLGYNFLKVLARDIITSNDPILDKKIVFRCNCPDFASELFKYEEICEKFDDLFSNKTSTGVFTLGEMSIFYYERIGFLTKKRRNRLRIAVDLMCDFLDVLYFYNKGIR